MTLNSILLVSALALAGCGNASVQSDADARRAYLGLDASIDKAIQLGFDGFNSPSNGANIAPQTANGTVHGTLTVTGQVDQGSSNNKNMTLSTNYAAYSDDGMITYDATAGSLPVLSMSLKGIPTGTLTGSLAGSLTMTGDSIKNGIVLAVAFSATLQSGGNNTVVRAPGTTHITGTATSDYGVYTIDITR
jgi:phage baseplate assembly protein gpV